MSENTETTTTDEAVQTLSPYKATAVVNELLAEAGLTDKKDDSKPRQLPAQMLYQYCNKGYIKASKNEAGKWEIKVTDLTEWVAAYITKQNALAEKKAAKLQAELAGETESTEADAKVDEHAEV